MPPPMSEPERAVRRLLEIMDKLRDPGGCPWDREQTLRTLTPYLLEEAHEVIEAIEAGDVSHHKEELGDLLFQVVFHATLAAEEGAFTLADVASGIHDKLVHRHPHVFGTVEVETAGDVMRNWEQIKQAEKGRASIMDGIPGDLPSLLYAHKVQRKAASAGTDVVPVGDAATDEEVGALLFGVVARARQVGVDPEAALRAATARFRDAFMEKESNDGSRRARRA